MTIASNAVHTGAWLDQTTGSALTPSDSRTGKSAWSSGASSGARPYVASPTRRRTLLFAGHVRIRWLRRVESRPVVGVADEHRRIEDHLRQPCVVGIIDVLRLVGHLVVVLVLATRQRNAGNAVACVAVVIRAAVILLGMSGRVVLDVEHERRGLLCIRCFDPIAKLFRQAAQSNDLEIRR